jgi:integrase/recombinase XerD
MVATLRAYLKERHAQGILSRPLHLQIDTPRVYRGERLPRALPWAQVCAFIQSIDRSDPMGRRDFTLLYMAAAYGLRSSELVHLTLDDIDWRGRTLCIIQNKTRQTIQLPLTDEAANVLIDYLRNARPKSSHRQLFLRMIAPQTPLKPTGVYDVLEHRIRCSKLDLPSFGTHVLRHSFATRLMKQGVSIKVIGNSLGHRNIESTTNYLRLNLDDLQDVGLPVPATFPSDPRKLVSLRSIPRIKPASPVYNFTAHFRSRFALSLQRFIDLKRALGRVYVCETKVLRHWDDFVYRQHPRANKVFPEMFTEWSKTLASLTSTGRRSSQQIIRHFLLFHARDHIGTFIPDRLTFPKATPVVSPRLVSETEMSRVLAVAQQLSPTAANPLRAETFHIGFTILFCCGLRRGELLRLKLGDIQEEQTVLYIRSSKFHKSRLVPLSSSVTVQLRKYLQKRKEKNLPMTPESFLMCSRRRSPEVYCSVCLLTTWHQLCVSAQVLNTKGHPPRVHDLRHSAAVLMLQRWYAQGSDVQDKLPHLATYLGHVSVGSTHYYLKLTPELREAASQRFHQQFASLLTRGGVA